MAKKWGTDTTIRFIKEYEKHPCLWDYCSELYKNRESRENAYREISRAMSMPSFDSTAVKSKIRILRNTYNMELSKISKSVQSPVATGELYRPTLAWFPFADRFLKKVTKRRDLESTPKKEVFEDVSDVCEGDLDEGRSYVDDAIPNGGAYLGMEGTRIHQEFEQQHQMTHHQQHLAHQHQQLGHQQQIHLQPRLDCLQEQDEFEAFAKSIACQMRQLPLELAVELQADIQSLISQKRLIILRHQSNYSRQMDARYQH